MSLFKTQLSLKTGVGGGWVYFKREHNTLQDLVYPYFNFICHLPPPTLQVFPNDIKPMVIPYHGLTSPRRHHPPVSSSCPTPLSLLYLLLYIASEHSSGAIFSRDPSLTSSKANDSFSALPE